MRYFVYKIKEVKEKTLSWGAQGKAKGLLIIKGYVEDNYKISTKFNEVIVIFPSTELQKDETSINFGSQTLNIRCTIVGVFNNGRGTQKNFRAFTCTHFGTPLAFLNPRSTPGTRVAARIFLYIMGECFALSCLIRLTCQVLVLILVAIASTLYDWQ